MPVEKIESDQDHKVTLSSIDGELVATMYPYAGIVTGYDEHGVAIQFTNGLEEHVPYSRIETSVRTASKLPIEMRKYMGHKIDAKKILAINPHDLKPGDRVGFGMDSGREQGMATAGKVEANDGSTVTIVWDDGSFDELPVDADIWSAMERVGAKKETQKKTASRKQADHTPDHKECPKFVNEAGKKICVHNFSLDNRSVTMVDEDGNEFMEDVDPSDIPVDAMEDGDDDGVEASRKIRITADAESVWTINAEGEPDRQFTPSEFVNLAGSMGMKHVIAKKLVELAQNRPGEFAEYVPSIEKINVASLDRAGEKILAAAPPGWEGTIKQMKGKSDIDDPYALAWDMYKKGYKPHYKESSKNRTAWPEIKDSEGDTHTVVDFDVTETGENEEILDGEIIIQDEEGDNQVLDLDSKGKHDYTPEEEESILEAMSKGFPKKTSMALVRKGYRICAEKVPEDMKTVEQIAEETRTDDSGDGMKAPTSLG